jgi:uncharacterized membrane protein
VIFLRSFGIIFLLGAFGYGLIETVWRGYSHWTMMIAGGISFTVFALISRCGIPLLYKCIFGSFTVTVIELCFGSVFNLGLGLHVWDYSNLPFNLFGQVCLLYSVLWGWLSLVAVPFAGAALNRLSGTTKIAEGSYYELSAQGLGGN